MLYIVHIHHCIMLVTYQFKLEWTLTSAESIDNYFIFTLINISNSHMITTPFIKSRNLFRSILTSICMMLCTLNSLAQEVKPQKFIGSEYNDIQEIPYFKNISGSAGQLLTDRSLSVSDITKNGRHFIFLNSISNLSDKKIKIIQALDPGKVSTAEELCIGRSYLNGKKDVYIVAIAKSEKGDKERLTKVRKAWKIDLGTKNFVLIDANKVTCENEGYGL